MKKQSKAIGASLSAALGVAIVETLKMNGIVLSEAFAAAIPVILAYAGTYFAPANAG